MSETVIASAERLEALSNSFRTAADDLSRDVVTWRAGISAFTKPPGSDTTSQMVAKIYDTLHTSSDRFGEIVEGLHKLGDNIHTMGQNYIVTEQANKS